MAVDMAGPAATKATAAETSATRAGIDPLSLLWSYYRGWALRARHTKSQLDRWRLAALLMTILGAVLGTVATVLKIHWPDAASVGQWVAGGSAVSMALAAYIAQSMLGTQQQQRWLRARSLAESCKSEAYKLATGAPPYDGPGAGTALLERLEKLLAANAEVAREDVNNVKLPAEFSGGTMSLSVYIETRVLDQIKKFFRPKATGYERYATWCRSATTLLSGIGAVLGAIGATTPNPMVDPWVAVVGTISTAIGAHALSQRFEYLAATYRTTADRLDLLIAGYQLRPESDKQDPKMQKDLVLQSEAILAAENTAWMAELVGTQK